MTNKVNMAHAIAMVTTLTGVILHILGISAGIYCMLAGAALLFFVRLYMRAKATDKKLMRLLSIMMFGATLLICSALMIYSGKRYWVIPLLVDAVVELYVSFRMEKR